MKMKTLRIALEKPYSAPGPNNRYIATLEVDWNNTEMKVQLPDETCARVLALCDEDIAAGAQVQINEFVNAALAASETALIEGVRA
jgi:hypothetical protein